MQQIPHWVSGQTLVVAESESGVRVTGHPADNIVHPPGFHWPEPELLQKCYANRRFRGRTPADDAFARAGMGYYSDLQSLNGEDAATWSVFGVLARLDPNERLAAFNRLLARFDEKPVAAPPTGWLWRRLPHPEKPSSIGGPEIDFGFITPDLFLLGEAKWNGKLGQKQGVGGNRSQFELRMQYLQTMADLALRGRRRYIVLGVGRTNDVFGVPLRADGLAHVYSITWSVAAEVFPSPLREEIFAYLQWKETYGPSSRRRRDVGSKRKPSSRGVRLRRSLT